MKWLVAPLLGSLPRSRKNVSKLPDSGQWCHSAYYQFKMDSVEWYVDRAMRLLFTTCYVITTVNLSIYVIFFKQKRTLFCSCTQFRYKHCPQMKLRHLLKKIRSLPNEMTMFRICTSNVSCGCGEIVIYFTFTMWRHCRRAWNVSRCSLIVVTI